MTGDDDGKGEFLGPFMVQAASSQTFWDHDQSFKCWLMKHRSFRDQSLACDERAVNMTLPLLYTPGAAKNRVPFKVYNQLRHIDGHNTADKWNDLE